jgi:TRAP transporter TAXI family solute receptor
MTTQHTALKGARTIPRRVVVACCIVMLIGCVSPMAVASDILLGTDSPGSFSHFVGRAICRTLNRSTANLTCEVIPADSDTHNLTNLNGGSLDLALLDSRLLYDAMTRKGRFQFLDIRYDNLGALLPLYDLPILLVARADAGIAELSDLKGERINIGIAYTKVRDAVDFIMTAKGWTKSDFKLVQELPASLSQDTMAFCHGNIDAMVHIGVHPDPALQQLMDLCAAVPVDMDDDDIIRTVDGNPAFSSVNIPAGTYPGLEKPVATFGTRILLVASGSLDEESALAVMTLLAEHQDSLQSIHPVLGQFSVKPSGGPDIGIALHPGAAAYFESQGN